MGRPNNNFFQVFQRQSCFGRILIGNGIGWGNSIALKKGKLDFNVRFDWHQVLMNSGPVHDATPRHVGTIQRMTSCPARPTRIGTRWMRPFVEKLRRRLLKWGLPKWSSFVILRIIYHCYIRHHERAINITPITTVTSTSRNFALVIEHAI